LRFSSNKFFNVVIGCSVHELREASGKAAAFAQSRAETQAKYLTSSAPRERGSAACLDARGRRMLENACAKKRRLNPAWV